MQHQQRRVDRPVLEQQLLALPRAESQPDPEAGLGNRRVFALANAAAVVLKPHRRWKTAEVGNGRAATALSAMESAATIECCRGDALRGRTDPVDRPSSNRVNFMRALIVIIVVIAALFLIGWLSFSWTGDRASIGVETEAIQEDTGNMVDSARELVDSADRKLEQTDDAEPVEVERVEVEVEPAEVER